MNSSVTRRATASATVGSLLLIMGSLLLIPALVAEIPVCGMMMPSLQPTPAGCLPGGSSILLLDDLLTPGMINGLTLVASGLVFRFGARIRGLLGGGRHG